MHTKYHLIKEMPSLQNTLNAHLNSINSQSPWLLSHHHATPPGLKNCARASSSRRGSDASERRGEIQAVLFIQKCHTRLKSARSWCSEHSVAF